jgi:hypothetical protein
MIGFIDTLYTQPVTTINYIAIAISTLYSSLLHSVFIVLSWKRVYNSLTEIAVHYEVFFAQPNSFLGIFFQLFCQLRRLSQFWFYLPEILVI